MFYRVAIGASALCVTCAAGDIYDNFESYQIGGSPGGIWVDASSYIQNPTNPGPTVSMIQTIDANGNDTRAVQINDALGTSGGIAGQVERQQIQRFESDIRFDQASDGNYPNWVIASGFFQVTDEPDLISMPQAVVYALNTSRRFRLYVHNADGQGGRTLDVALGSATWDFDHWYRVSLEVDTETGAFTSTVIDLESGEIIIDNTRTMNGWNPEFGQYDLISVNDGEYGTNTGTRGNVVSIDNARYIPSPGAVSLIGACGVVCASKRRRA